MRQDFVVSDFQRPPHPKGVVLNGNTVRLEPLNVEKHSKDLFAPSKVEQTLH
jgi:hypothetical protein